METYSLKSKNYYAKFKQVIRLSNILLILEIKEYCSYDHSENKSWSFKQHSSSTILIPFTSYVSIHFRFLLRQQCQIRTYIKMTARLYSTLITVTAFLQRYSSTKVVLITFSKGVEAARALQIAEGVEAIPVQSRHTYKMQNEPCDLFSICCGVGFSWY